MPKVSVVIPCFNQGQFINETVESILNQSYQDFEIIIVNDGSTDEYTNKLLENYNKPKTKIIKTTNQGVSSARNIAVNIAEGIYILPLDADDLIHKDYIKKALDIFDNNPNISIVYCDVKRFGVVNETWIMPEYTIENILINNVMVCSSFFRKVDWELVNGYNSNMIYGLEDWDFWISLIELNKKAYKIPEILFYYRVKDISISTNLDSIKKEKMYIQIYNNHKKLFNENIITLVKKISKHENEIFELKNTNTFKLAHYISKLFRLIKKVKK